MCGGCNILAEGAGVSVIMGRYWWVARQGARAVAAAEAIVSEGALDLPAKDFSDPMADVNRIVGRLDVESVLMPEVLDAEPAVAAR